MITTDRSMAEELRRVRVPVATSDVITAVESLDHIDLTDPREVREALAASLIKNGEHRASFDLLFDLFFAERPVVAGGRPFEALSDDELRNALLTALGQGNRHLLREIAAEAVTRHARIQPGRRAAGTYYIFKTLDALHADTLRDELSNPHGGGDPRISWLDEQNRLRASDAVVTGFERIVESEVRNRLVAEQGAASMAGMLRNPLPEDEDFLTASIDAVKRMDAAVVPLARNLGRILLADRRTAPRTIDMRRTLRRSLSNGGTPIDLVFKPANPPKPRLVILADVSGSVASFATFALQLAFALRAHFSRQRSFVFVDGTDDVTDLIGDVRSITAATARINSEGRGVWIDGHSDYGNAFATFVEHHIASVDTRTTVLVLGDGRNNYRDPRPEALATIHARSGRLYWLNPESPRLWQDGDAAMGDYAPHCDDVIECRTIRQLEGFIRSLNQTRRL